MSDSNLHELFKTAQDYYERNGYDLNEPDAKARENNWHHSLALAVDDLELSTFRKLHMFSECIRNFDAEIAHLKNNGAKEQ